MEAERIGAVGRAGGEDAGEGSILVAARMNLESGAAGTMKPGDQNELLADGEAVERVGEFAVDVEPGVRCAFAALARRAFAVLERRADHGDGAKSEIDFGRHGVLPKKMIMQKA